MVEATDELRERLLAVIGRETNHTDGDWDDEALADAILSEVAAVVAEARTEGAIAELEALMSAERERGIKYWGDPHAAICWACDVAPGIEARLAALREGGNQNAEPEGEWEYSIAGHNDMRFKSYGSAERYNTMLANLDVDPGSILKRRKGGEWIPAVADQKVTEQ